MISSHVTTNPLPVLLALLFILVLPWLAYWQARQAGESFGVWWLRSEYEQSKGLRQKLRAASWLTPYLFAQYLSRVGRVTYGVFWLMVGVILLGDFFSWPLSWKKIPSLAWLLGSGLEALLLFGLLGLWRTCESARRKDEAAIPMGKLAFHWLLLGLYTFALVQGLAHFVKDPDFFLFRMIVVGKQLKTNESLEQGMARMRQASEEDIDRWIEIRNLPRGYTWQWEPRKAPPEVLAELQKRYQGQVLLPEMRSLPGGEFMMGCDESSEERKLLRLDLPSYHTPANARACRYDELPYHPEQVAPFQIGKYEVSFDEWDACVADQGCEHWPDDHGRGRGKLPVSDVSWDDVQQYLAWLNRKTGQGYRLPSEAEWEYAARSGQPGAFASGTCLSRKMANYNGAPQDSSTCERETPSRGPLSVGSLQANRWGLHDMHGNVAEWVSNQRSRGYEKDWQSSSVDRKRRGLRGGAWQDSAETARSAHRGFLRQDARVERVGFRVVR